MGILFKEGEERRRVSREDKIYTLVMKTSMEEITYFGLIDRICRKIIINEATTKRGSRK